MKPVDIAISQLGVEENPRGSNWGAEIKEYLNSVGINFQASWCMAFVYWCVRECCAVTGEPNILVQTGGVLHQWNNIDDRYKLTGADLAQAGDIFIMDLGKGLGHTGFVEGVEGNTLHTIEGNTNDTGSREGYEVCRRTRKKSAIKGLIRIPDAIAA
jgi:hypothetical protein